MSFIKLNAFSKAIVRDFAKRLALVFRIDELCPVTTSRFIEMGERDDSHRSNEVVVTGVDLVECQFYPDSANLAFAVHHLVGGSKRVTVLGFDGVKMVTLAASHTEEAWDIAMSNDDIRNMEQALTVSPVADIDSDFDIDCEGDDDFDEVVADEEEDSDVSDGEPEVTVEAVTSSMDFALILAQMIRMFHNEISELVLQGDKPRFGTSSLDLDLIATLKKLDAHRDGNLDFPVIEEARRAVSDATMSVLNRMMKPDEITDGRYEMATSNAVVFLFDEIGAGTHTLSQFANRLTWELIEFWCGNDEWKPFSK
jgi:hypothetical protein